MGEYAKGVGFGARLGNTKVGVVGLFKFSPATTGNYVFVSECANRGSCVDGVCECYKGYTRTTARPSRPTPSNRPRPPGGATTPRCRFWGLSASDKGGLLCAS